MTKLWKFQVFHIWPFFLTYSTTTWPQIFQKIIFFNFFLIWDKVKKILNRKNIEIFQKLAILWWFKGSNSDAILAGYIFVLRLMAGFISFLSHTIWHTASKAENFRFLSKNWFLGQRLRRRKRVEIPQFFDPQSIDGPPSSLERSPSPKNVLEM